MKLVKVMPMFPDFRRKAFTLSYDDGIISDKRLLEMMKAHGVKGTFNLVGSAADKTAFFSKNSVTDEDELRAIYGDPSVEVATHGYTHPSCDRIPLSDVALEIVHDRETLERIFGCQVKGHAYPYGAVNGKIADILRKCGIVYARTVRSTHDFRLPSDPLFLDPTCHHDDGELFALAEKFASKDPEPWNDPWLFYVWGHTYEFNNNDNWDRMEKLLSTVGGRDDVWYATNGEIVGYKRAFDRLVYSADGLMIRNPSSLTVYIGVDVDRKRIVNFAVRPGETLNIRQYLEK